MSAENVRAIFNRLLFDWEHALHMAYGYMGDYSEAKERKNKYIADLEMALTDMADMSPRLSPKEVESLYDDVLLEALAHEDELQ